MSQCSEWVVQCTHSCPGGGVWGGTGTRRGVQRGGGYMEEVEVNIILCKLVKAVTLK